jgi:hypothetical protein
MDAPFNGWKVEPEILQAKQRPMTFKQAIVTGILFPGNI